MIEHEFDNPFSECALCMHLEECAPGEDGQMYGYTCLRYLPDHAKEHYDYSSEPEADCPICKLQIELGFKKESGAAPKREEDSDVYEVDVDLSAF